VSGPVCRHSLEQECRVLLVHGILHLLGHDHELGQEVRPWSHVDEHHTCSAVHTMATLCSRA
jgi:ssRNA-specific RNase YbeY (16S rRNA maturation enzyme)